MPTVTADTKVAYLVAKEIPLTQHKVGDELNLTEAVAADYVAKGFLTVKQESIENQIREQARSLVEGIARTTVLDAMTETNKAIRANGRPRVTVPEKAFAEAKEDRSFGDFLEAVAGVSMGAIDPIGYQKSVGKITQKYNTTINPNFGRDYSRVHGSQGKAWESASHQGLNLETVDKASVQVESVGALGGVTVPIEYSRQLFQLAGDQAILMPRVTQYAMGSETLMIPALDYSLGGSGKSPYLAGMNATWTAENFAFSQQNASFRQIELKANLLAGFTQASRQLLQDNTANLEQVMTNLFAKAIGFNVDYAIFLGDGVNKPRGMMNSGAAVAVSRTSPANGTLLTDMSAIDAAMLPELEGEAIWMVAPSFKKALYPMTDASGRVVFLPNFPGQDVGPAGIKPRMAVFGKSLFWSQLPASNGSKFDINLIIPSAYAFGHRENIEIGVSDQFAFTSNLLTWRFLFRGDGASLLNTSLTLQNGDVVAPFAYRTT
jgi:HK97 family phage major capsid protein